MSTTRRSFLGGMASLAACRGMLAQLAAACPFRLAVINDEISQDFEHACHVASRDLGLSWIELRSLWGNSLAKLNAAQIAEAQRILTRYNLRVTDFASPLFKVDFPGAPLSKESPSHDTFHASFTFKEQDELLERLIDLCRTFATDRIRCFDFWRLENPAPFRAAMNAKLQEAARKCASHNVILLLENEMSCNTGSGKEAAATLSEIPDANFMLNWDPGNSATFAADVPYPDDYALLPKARIGHVHCKNVQRTPGQARAFQWQPVNIGVVDWVGQFRALKRDGYHHAVSLETHWRGGAGTTPDEKAEASTRISMAGLRECLGKAGITC
jgi:sugar phosphate isomerase/epimerase